MIYYQKQRRITFVDYAKGITILFVIIGHLNNVPPDLRMKIFSFHVPLFFLTSGYFIKNYRRDIE